MEFQNHDSRFRENWIEPYRHVMIPIYLDLSANRISALPGVATIFGPRVVDYPIFIGIVYPYRPSRWICSSSQRICRVIIRVASHRTPFVTVVDGHGVPNVSLKRKFSDRGDNEVEIQRGCVVIENVYIVVEDDGRVGGACLLDS